MRFFIHCDDKINCSINHEELLKVELRILESLTCKSDVLVVMNFDAILIIILDE